MSPVVLDLPSNHNRTLRLYAHCARTSQQVGGQDIGSAGAGSVALLVLNLADTAAAISSVSLNNSWQLAPRTEWILTAPGGDLASHRVEVNGKQVSATPEVLAAPALHRLGRLVQDCHPAGAAFGCARGLWTLPPRSVGFAILQLASATACP